LGGSGDIGMGVAAKFAARGDVVALAGRDGARLDAVAARIGNGAIGCSHDLRDPAEAQALVDEVVAKLGRLDVLVGVAGQFKRGDLTQVTPKDWQDGFAMMFFGMVYAVTAAWPHLKASRGHVVLTSGVFAHQPPATGSIPGALAGAVHNFSKSTAELGLKDGVTVNCILPGPIAGRRMDENLVKFAAERGLDREAALAAYAERFGIERVGKPEDVAEVVAFLTSPGAAFVKGASIVIDGGVTRLA
jgi:3-oxoacyl-[acyl-carrier protein] reductase